MVVRFAVCRHLCYGILSEVFRSTHFCKFLSGRAGQINRSSGRTNTSVLPHDAQDLSERCIPVIRESGISNLHTSDDEV